MRKILSFYYQKRVRLFSKILLLPLGLLNFVLLGAVNNSNAQTLNNAAQQRWTGVWADVSGQQNGTLDVTITSAGAMTGVIINSTLHLEGTWNGQISDNGELRANYTYNFNGQPYTFLAQGVLQLNNNQQLISKVDFSYQNKKISSGNFVLTRANSLPGNSTASQGNSELSELLKNKPVGNEKLLQNGYPNVNDYRNDYQGYINQLVPGYTDLLKDNWDYVHNRANQQPSYGNVQNAGKPAENGTGSDVPPFLLHAWLVAGYQGYGATTYDFTWYKGEGQRGVSIQRWQKIGTLGWQSNQNFTYCTFQYNAAANKIIMSSATGYHEEWNIIKVENTEMVVESNGNQFRVYNCSAEGWPDVIKASMRGCR